MTSTAAINGIEKPTATFNAVKIQVNDPKTNVPEVLQNNFGNSDFNGVNIEINRPSVEANRNLIYDYPEAKGIVTYNMSGVTPVKDLPSLPVSYQTNINNVVNNEVELEEAQTEEEGSVPRPSLTNPESEKKLSFHGKAPEASTNISEVITKLNDTDYDKQALQMRDIFITANKTPEKADEYVKTEVFEALINILKKDTKSLEGPSEKQTEIRKKIIINEMTKMQAERNNQNISEVKLPYEINEDEIKKAMVLSPMEQAERNKDYAMLTIASLAKVYSSNVEKQTGNIVPITDLPGISVIVDTLRHNSNPGTKKAALVALQSLDRPEYKKELESIFILATQKNK